MDPMENASRLRRKKKSILYRWLISYGIILALTVALSGGIFLALENDLSQEIERTNQMRLSIVQKELDSRLELQKKLLMQVASSPELAELTRESGLTRARRASLVRKLTEQYRSMRASHSNVKEIFVYLSAADSCLSTRGAADKEIMHDVLFTMEFDQWTAFMEEKHRGEFVLMEMVEKGSDSPRVPDVAYACSYPMSPAARPRATVLVVMSDGLLGEKLEALCADGSSISVETGEGETLFSVCETASAGDLVVSGIASEETGWRYVIRTPKKAYWKSAYRVRTVCFLALAGMLAGGIALSVWMARKNYSPMDKLIKQIGAQSHQKIQDGETEYAYLLNTLTSALREKNTSLDRAEQQTARLRKHFLSRFAGGELRAFSPNDQDQLGFSFPSDKFLLAIFDVDDPAALFPEEPDMDAEERSAMAELILENIMGELIGRRHSAYFFERENQQAVLISLSPEADADIAGELAKAFECGAEIIKQNFDLDVRAALSRVHSGTASIPECYREAYEAMEYLQLTGTGGVGTFSGLRTDLGAEYYYPIESEIHLIHTIHSGDRQETERLLSEIFDANFSGGFLTPKLTQCLAFDLVSTILKVAGELDAAQEPPIDLGKVGALVSRMDVPGLRECIRQAAGELCGLASSVNEQKKTPGGRFSDVEDQVIRYVQENYSSMEINMKSIGDQFGVTPYYLSRLFKNKTGQSIVDYIRFCRIEKAKELLLTTDWKLDDITRAVGYVDAKSLNRAFKQIYGVTPGKYKEIYKP